MTGRRELSIAIRGGSSDASGGSVIHAGTVHVHAGLTGVKALPARSVIAVATVATKFAGRASPFGSVMVTVRDRPSAASATVLATGAPPTASCTDASFTVEASTASENVTLIGSPKSPVALPRAGLTS